MPRIIFGSLTCQRKKFKVERQKDGEKEVTVIPPLLRSNITSPKPRPSTGIMPKLCMFCNKAAKKVNQKKVPLSQVQTKIFETSVKIYAEILDDAEMLSRIGSIDFISKEVHYHRQCRYEYQKGAELKENFILNNKSSVETNNSSIKSKWHSQREVHKKAFDSIICFINDAVIKNNEIISLADLNRHYEIILEEISGSENDSYSSAQKLQRKIFDHFQDSVKICQGKRRKGSIVYNGNLDINEVM